MPTIQVKLGSYAEYGAAADKLYRRVFLEEQGVPEEEIFDGRGEQCFYTVVFDGETPVAAVRLFQQGEVWKIGLVAVEKARRKQHLGETVMRASMQYISSHGGREILLDA